jgi:hypothetical protein
MRMSRQSLLLLHPPATPEQALPQVLGAHPDVLEDLLELSVQMLTRYPAQLLLSECWGPLAQLIAPCALVQHKEAWVATLHFAETLLGACTKRVDMQQQTLDVLDASVATIAPLLARSLVLGIAGAQPSSRVQQSCVVLRAVVDCTPSHGPGWIREGVSALPPAAQQLPEVVPLLTALTQSTIVMQDVKKAADAFSEACRRRRLVQ